MKQDLSNTSTSAKLSSDTCLGLVLAGGQSKRMGGGDKFLKPIGETNLLREVVTRLQPQVPQLIISTNSPKATITKALASSATNAPMQQAPNTLQTIPILKDNINDYAGPLAGIEAGMRWARQHTPHITHIASTAADTPFFPKTYVALLLQELKKSTPNQRNNTIILAQSANRIHPVFGLWPINLADNLKTALENGTRKVRAWTDQHPTLIASFPHHPHEGPTSDPFFNINTPDDWQSYKALCLKLGKTV